jgi:NADPH:quinone reductase-like Zn-dependent oxidoreductase
VTDTPYASPGDIKPLLAGTYPLSELGRAQDDFKKKNFIGKLVIKVD